MVNSFDWLYFKIFLFFHISMFSYFFFDFSESRDQLEALRMVQNVREDGEEKYLRTVGP